MPGCSEIQEKGLLTFCLDNEEVDYIIFKAVCNFWTRGIQTQLYLIIAVAGFLSSNIPEALSITNLIWTLNQAFLYKILRKWTFIAQSTSIAHLWQSATQFQFCTINSLVLFLGLSDKEAIFNFNNEQSR